MSDKSETFIDIIRRSREPGAAPSQALRIVPTVSPPRLNTHALAVQAGADLAAEMAAGGPRRSDGPGGDVEMNAEDEQ